MKKPKFHNEKFKIFVEASKASNSTQIPKRVYKTQHHILFQISSCQDGISHSLPYTFETFIDFRIINRDVTPPWRTWNGQFFFNVLPALCWCQISWVMSYLKHYQGVFYSLIHHSNRLYCLRCSFLRLALKYMLDVCCTSKISQTAIHSTSPGTWNSQDPPPFDMVMILQCIQRCITMFTQISSHQL